jgi:hypothetical protein
MRDVVASYEWNRDTNSDVRIDDGAFQTLADHRLVKEHGPFGLVYTERSLINLPSADAQAQAIRECCALVKPGGTFLAVEHSQDGLDECNRWRAMLGLPAIEVPIQNRYLRDAEVLACARELAAAGATEAQIIPELGIQVFFGSEDFAGLYYFVSRILHGANPDYDHPDNQTILRLPLGPGPSGFRGYAHAWAFRKVAA